MDVADNIKWRFEMYDNVIALENPLRGLADGKDDREIECRDWESDTDLSHLGGVKTK
jgi:hypothetical protein